MPPVAEAAETAGSVPHIPVHEYKEPSQLTPEEEILSNEQQDSEPVVEEKGDVIREDNIPTVQFPQFNAQLDKSMEVIGSSETAVNDTSTGGTTPGTQLSSRGYPCFRNNYHS